MKRETLIFRLGAGDRTKIYSEPSTQVTEIELLDINGNLQFGIGDTIISMQQTGLEVSAPGADLLLLASAVYCADKRLSRTEISQDGWTREIDIHLPVSQPDVWNPVRSKLEKMLGFLTGDLWRFSFRSQVNPVKEMTEQTTPLVELNPAGLCLFSGGLDSFIGAVDELEEGRNPLLISHGWVASDSSHQSDCLTALRKEYGDDRVRQIRSRIGFGEHDVKITTEGENTERSRSFLFFAIASAAASGLHNQVFTTVPENGLISLNIPLDSLRLGAFSTRTTHPYFVARFNELLAAIGIPTQLVNPYRYKTKGEMVAECRNQHLLQTMVDHTISCSSASKARWQGKAPGHCGHCVPCLIRRAALQSLGIPDPTIYTVGTLAGANHPSTQAEGEHIRSFQLAIYRLNKNPKSAPFLVQRAGPLSDYPGELGAFGAMYSRGLGEVERLLHGVRASPHV